MKTIREYNKKKLGYHEDSPIFLSPPKWSCDWYWNFGYLGNNLCHYNVKGLKVIEDYNIETESWSYKSYDLKEALDVHFGNSFIIKESQRWEFAELFETFYALKQTAEVLGRGGSHLSNNPCSGVIKNPDEVERINKTVLPVIFDAIYKLIDENLQNGSLINKMIDIDMNDTTENVVKFMNENGFKPDDLKDIEHFNKWDFSRIHGLYWETYHKNK